MNKIRVGITGQSGFIGTHLYNTLCLQKDVFDCQDFKDYFFYNSVQLQNFVKSCDVIVHLAAINRCEDLEQLYTVNIELIDRLLKACEATEAYPHIIFSSSIQENNQSPYGRSKIDGRTIFETWAKKNNTSFTGLLIPNVFGEFCRPNYNSVVATFSHNLINDIPVRIINDNEIPLIYVASLCKIICDDIKKIRANGKKTIHTLSVPEDIIMKVSTLLDLLLHFRDLYIVQGFIPELQNKDYINLFNTFRSYISVKDFFPRKLLMHSDNRGSFIETIRLKTGGQISFSTTNCGITRGNHFHTRKIERFTVIKGTAKISLRRIGTEEVHDFILNGEQPSYVDMPTWYTHNITNVGNEILYTQFWINEWYNQDDPDTFFEEV